MIIHLKSENPDVVMTSTYEFTIDRYYVVTIDTTNNNSIKYIGLTSDTLPRKEGSAVSDITFVIGHDKKDLASQVNWMLQKSAPQQEQAVEQGI